MTDRLSGSCRALWLTAAMAAGMTMPDAAAATATPAVAQPIRPGPVKGETVHLPKARGYAYCELNFVQGQPPALSLQMYNTSGQGPCALAKFAPLDPKTMAARFGANLVMKNPPRYWLMDKMWLYDAGETRDFDGVRATWMARTAPPPEALKPRKVPFNPYTPMVNSRHSKFVWNKGSQVYLLRDPDGKTWIMQAFTPLIDKTLTLDTLATLGSKLKLPPGWRYEVKTLDREFRTDQSKVPGFAVHAVADDLQNVYQGCGFDAACSTAL